MSIIYIRTPRCGSTSIVKVCQKNNIDYYGGRDMGFWGGDRVLEKNSSDLLWQCVSNYVGEDRFNKSFKFACIRNPFSRAVSMFKHESWKGVKTFKEFCHRVNDGDFPSECAKWHSQALFKHLVYDGKLKVNALIRLEVLQEDFNAICGHIGIKRQRLPHKNKSRHKHYIQYYDDETKKIIAENYREDIECFGYQFGE